MTQTDFLKTFAKYARLYNWTDDKNRLVGTKKRGRYAGVPFNAVTAVAHSLGLGVFPNTKRGTQQAARQLGMTQNLAMAVYSRSNRGHAQIVRGKLHNEAFV